MSERQYEPKCKVILYADDNSDSRLVENELKQRGIEYTRLARVAPLVRGQDDEEIPSVQLGLDFYRGVEQILLYMSRIEIYALTAKRDAALKSAESWKSVYGQLYSLWQYLDNRVNRYTELERTARALVAAEAIPTPLSPIFSERVKCYQQIAIASKALRAAVANLDEIKANE